MGSIGIRREDKHEWEARVPLTPDAVREFRQAGIDVVVQPSDIRVFSDDAYRAAGATVDEDLSGCNVVFAVKEIPESIMRSGGSYVFFSHTIKGQKHNMPMLAKMMELGCTLIDYEKITDDQGRRLVFFGHHAGLAGMIDTLCVLGRRLSALGIPTAFADAKLAYEYADLADARSSIEALGRRLEVPAKLAPMIFGFAGYGNVSRGAQEIADLLPIEQIEVDDLSKVVTRNDVRDRIFKVVFEEKHLVEPLDGAFELQEYYDHPERYRSVFDGHVVHLSALINAIFWTEKYPRLLSNAFLKNNDTRLLIIGDISCDIGGSVQCTVKATTPGLPAYVVEPKTGAIVDGWKAPGIAMMTTDCLPCELPRESSAAFTAALSPFVPPLAELDTSPAFDSATLPDAIRRATILWRGALTPDFAHLSRYLEA